VGNPYRVRETWRQLGRALAERRGAAGLSQKAFGEQVRYSRSSIGNIETGLQHVDRSFWARADDLLSAGGELIRGYDAAEALQRANQRPAAISAPSTAAAICDHGGSSRLRRRA
jgi:transcriptional regulator with XRE-family HTH domain